MQIVIVPVDGNWDMANLLPYVSTERKNSIAHFVREIDARRALLSECLVRSMLLSHCSCTNDRIQLKRHPYGKPYAASHPDFHYNVSHAGKWVVCAVAARPLGIDVEYIRPIDLSIAEQFFAVAERKSMLSLPESNRLSMFYQIWTLKESFVKATGTGLTVPLHQIVFTVGGLDDIQMNETSPLPLHPPYHFRMYAPDCDHIIAVCASDCKFPTRLHEGTVPALTEIFLAHSGR